jgi:hypothetical protein
MFRLVGVANLRLTKNESRHPFLWARSQALICGELLETIESLPFISYYQLLLENPEYPSGDLGMLGPAFFRN